MLLMGDDMGRTQQGNNNAYCQDNELSWLDWNLKEQNAELFRFSQVLVALRKAHPALRHFHFAGSGSGESGALEISWHGTQPWRPDFSGTSRVLAFQSRLRGGNPDDVVYAAFNMYRETLPFEPPTLDDGLQWHVFVNTGLEFPDDVCALGGEPLPENMKELLVRGRSVVILVAR